MINNIIETQINNFRHSGMDCRNPVAMDGNSKLHPCILDIGNPCRYDDIFVCGCM
jgi:hypothetical protein